MSEAAEPVTVPMDTLSRKLFGLAMTLAILSAFAFQGSRGLYESTEGRYAECARETIASGNMLEPMLNGENHWTKPPLTYAAISAGLVCFGYNPWGARIYLSIAFTLTVLLVYWAGKSMWDKKTGALSALIYATSPYMVASAFAISCDTLVTFFQAACVAFFWLAMAKNKKIFVFLMWIALGFAALTKGPAAVICLFGIFPAYFFLWRSGKPVPRFFTLSGMAASALVGGGWYLYENHLHPGLFHYWLHDETVGRFTANEFQRNPEVYKIITMYLPIVLFGAAPWIFVLFILRKHLGVDKAMLKKWREWEELPQWSFVLAGFLVPLILLSISTSRMPLYLLPLFTPLALGLGRGFALLVEQDRLRLKTIIIVAVCCTALFVTGKAVSSWKHTRSDMGALSAIVHPILKKNPGSDVIIACREDLNGLDFYLQRNLTRIKFPTKPTDTPESIGAGKILPPGTLIVGRSKHLKIALDTLPESLYSLAYKDKDWTILRVSEPFNVGETLDKTNASLPDEN
jgi:4-amino-4-deoxy-L-arabinose transferase-like glycosyltransferase